MDAMARRWGGAVGGGRGAAGAATSAALAAIGVSLVAGGGILQRTFDPEVIGALALFLWPAWLLGAMCTFFGVVAFALAVLSTAASFGALMVRRSLSGQR